MFSSSFHRCFLVLIACCSCLAVGCVSKGKYYDSLKASASTKSELGIVETDLGDAHAEIARQEALVEGLRKEIDRLDTSVEYLSIQSESAQVQIGTSLNKKQEELELTKAVLATAEQQLNELVGYHSSKVNRLNEVESLLDRALTDLPEKQVSSSRQGDDAIIVRFGEGLFFKGNGSELSDFGSALVQKLGVSFNGQSDLLLDVVAYSSGSAESVKSWESASVRANTIAFAFVELYQLSPKQVSATARQGEITLIDGAPAESKQQESVELVVHLNPLRYPMPALK